MARVTISARGVQQLAAPGGDLDRYVQKVAEQAADRARYHLRHQGLHRHYKIPSDLKISVRRAGALRGQGVQYRVIATGRLANIYEFGSKPHVIRASPVLAFDSRKLRKKVIVRRPSAAQRSPSGGYRTINLSNRVITFKGYVDHPGTKAIRYMQKALRDVEVGGAVLG
jgi:hypothetical protein